MIKKISRPGLYTARDCFILFNIIMLVFNFKAFLIFLVKVSLVSHTGLDIKSSPCVGGPHGSGRPRWALEMSEQCNPFTPASAHSELLSTAICRKPRTLQLEVGNEIPAFFLPEHTLSLSKVWENQILLSFQKYLSWSFGRIPSWWESAISKKAVNKSPGNTDFPSNCIIPVAQGRPGPSAASRFRWGPSGKDLSWQYAKRKPMKIRWELQCLNFSY